MKADYRNWVPKGMLVSMYAAAALLAVLSAVFAFTGFPGEGILKTALTAVTAAGAVIMLAMSVWMNVLHARFSYSGKRQMARQITEGIAAYIDVPDGSSCLDVGCGSGALTIACAKRNPGSTVTGIDRWGREYASYSRDLCERNAAAEGVRNTEFLRGNAVKLDFPDETFDAVMSNYVYHNIPSRDRKELLLETLRTLKKGGVFAIHDIMSPARYGDMQKFVEKLKDMGYERAELIDTTDGMFMSRKEAVFMDLAGSALLTGRK